MTDEENITEAAIEYLKRKLRVSHPEGKMDKGKWFPVAYLECCNPIRRPSNAYPFSLMTHSRTAIHVAKEYGVEGKALKDRTKIMNLPLLLGRDTSIDDYIAKKLRG